MARCLILKHEEVSLKPRNSHTKKQGITVYTSNSSTREVEKGGTLEFTLGQPV